MKTPYCLREDVIRQLSDIESEADHLARLPNVTINETNHLLAELAGWVKCWIEDHDRRDWREQ